jgi:hypothetical protein
VTIYVHYKATFKMRISSAAIIAVVTLSQGTEAFFVQPNSVVRNYDTSISAVAPTLIIGPMIRKMREEKDKKKMPMAAADEAALEAPGLRVGKNAWKWPPVWPYDVTSFVPKVDEVPLAAPDLASVANMVTGSTPVPSPATVSDKDKLDPLKYWGEEKADVPTELSPGAAENLRR